MVEEDTKNIIVIGGITVGIIFYFYLFVGGILC